MQKRLPVTSWILSITTFLVTLVSIQGGVVVDRKNTCDVISDDSCNCFQPHTLRCHLNSSSHLEDVLKVLNNNSEVSEDIRLLDLTVDRLLKFPAGLFGNLSLSGLLISSSGSMTTIEDGAFAGGQLEQTLVALKMPGNGFEFVPSEIGELRNLASLDLSENAVGKLDGNLLRTLESLEELNLGHNLLIELNGVILPSKLQTFNVQNNQISLNGIRSFDYGSLNYLDLSNNKLTGNLTSSTLGGRKGKRLLKTLDLSFNNLSRIGDGAFKRFPSLTKLNLKSNSLEILHQRAFENLPTLNWLDLSHNRILELVSGTFDSLSGLIHLDLSFNHLQVLDGRLIQGLVSLSYLNVRSNNIFKVEKGIVENCPSCRTLILTDNPLDCTCQLADFQSWLQTSNKLDRTTKREAKCATPTVNANAILYNLKPLVCNDDTGDDGDESTFDISTLDLPPVISLKSQLFEGELLNLTWEVRLNVFKCQNLQIFSEDLEGIPQEVYSRPLDCERHHESPHGVDLVMTSLELSKIVTNDNISSMANSTNSLLACLVLINEENESLRPPVVSGCSNVLLPVQDETGRNEVVVSSKTSLSLLHASLNWKNESLSVFFRVQVPDEVAESACKLVLQVKDADATDSVVAQQAVSCRTQKFHFQQMSLHKQNFYEVCAKLETGIDGLEDSDTNSQCVSVEREVEAATTKSYSTTSSTKEPILPLVLTLVFLAIGIAVLVVLYLVVKGYLSDRHRPGFLPEPQHPSRAGKILDSLVSSLYWTSQLFSWKHRRRRRHHMPVREVDEMSLQDNLTVTSLFSD